MITKDSIIQKAIKSKRESKYIDFKEQLDFNSSRDICEIIKDIVAMANSGGGGILIGVKDNGDNSGFNVINILNYDSAKIIDKIAKYTGMNYSDFEIIEIIRNKKRIALILIYGSNIPLVFIKPGIYSIKENKTKTAFGQGTIYFRHGAKSEPGNYNDLQNAIEREVKRKRKEWLGNIRKVVNAPSKSEVLVFPADVTYSPNNSTLPFRLTDDENAPAFRNENPDKTHPHRQKEIIKKFNKVVGTKKKINPYDILCVRQAYKIDESKPYFCYKSKFGSPQYSDSFLKWLLDNFTKNLNFFKEARKKYRPKSK